MNDISFKSARIVSTAIAVAAMAAALIVIIVVPQMNAITEIRGRIEETRAQTAAVVAEVKSYEQSFVELNRIGSSREDIAQMFPDRESMVSLVAGLEASVSAAGAGHRLTIVDLKEQAVAAGARQIDIKPRFALVPNTIQLEEVPFTVEVVGSYRSLADFFLGLENSGFITVINKLSITADAEQNDNGDLVSIGTGTGVFDGVFFVRSENQ